MENRRKIKFRAWEKTNKQWISAFGITDTGVYLAFINGYVLDKEAQKDIILMQSIGLKDKNGVEIFEGDIVETDKGTVGFINWYDALAKFGIHRNLMSIKEEKDTDDTFGSFVNVDDEYFKLTKIKVIGNIYDNEKLLEV